MQAGCLQRARNGRSGRACACVDADVAAQRALRRPGLGRTAAHHLHFYRHPPVARPQLPAPGGRKVQNLGNSERTSREAPASLHQPLKLRHSRLRALDCLLSTHVCSHAPPAAVMLHTWPISICDLLCFVLFNTTKAGARMPMERSRKLGSTHAAGTSARSSQKAGLGATASVSSA